MMMDVLIDVSVVERVIVIAEGIIVFVIAVGMIVVVVVKLTGVVVVVTLTSVMVTVVVFLYGSFAGRDGRGGVGAGFVVG